MNPESVIAAREWRMLHRRWLWRIDRLHNARRMYPNQLGYWYLYR